MPLHRRILAAMLAIFIAVPVCCCFGITQPVEKAAAHSCCSGGKDEAPKKAACDCDSATKAMADTDKPLPAPLVIELAAPVADAPWEAAWIAVAIEPTGRIPMDTGPPPLGRRLALLQSFLI